MKSFFFPFPPLVLYLYLCAIFDIGMLGVCCIHEPAGSPTLNPNPNPNPKHLPLLPCMRSFCGAFEKMCICKSQ